MSEVDNEPIGGFGSRREMFEELYVKEGLPLSRISLRLDVAQHTLSRWMDALGIPRRKPGGPNAPGTLLWKFHRYNPIDLFAMKNLAISRVFKCSAAIVYKYKRGVSALWNSVSLPQPQDLNDTGG